MSKLLDPDFLAKLNGLRLVPRLNLSHQPLGATLTSRVRGSSTEFVDYRPYVVGDEIKRIDWKVYARKDKYYLRTREGEASASVWVLLDASKSMNFKSKRASLTKWEFAAKLALGVSFVALNNADAAGLFLFGDRIVSEESAKSDWEVFDKMTGALEGVFSFCDQTSFKKSFQDIVQKIPRRSLLVVISDFLGAPTEEITQSLELLASFRHEVNVIRVIDPFEIDLKDRDLGSKAIRLASLEKETMPEIAVRLEEVQKDYQELFLREEGILRKRLLEKGINFFSLTTDQDPGDDLVRILHSRRILKTF